jgi:hypothetical protein
VRKNDKAPFFQELLAVSKKITSIPGTAQEIGHRQREQNA